MHKIFVSDYDGTITDKDFYSLLAERYVPANTPDYFARYREGRISHFEAMAAYFAFAPTEEQQLEELLAASQADPDLAHQLRFCSVRAGNFGWFRLAPPGTSSAFSRGPVWPRLYTRTRDTWRTGAGSYWRSWTLHPPIIRHRWAWINRPWFGTPSASQTLWHSPVTGRPTCSRPCSFSRACVSRGD